MKSKLEQILNSGKKLIATGLTLTLIGLTTPYCGGGGGSGGGGGNGPNPTNNPPVAIAGISSVAPSNQYHPSYVHPGNLVTLDGEDSYDSDGDDLTYSWSLNNKPDFSSLTSDDISSRDTPYPQFAPDATGNYELKLVVSDGKATSYDLVGVNATANQAPVAEAGNVISVPRNIQFDINAINSYDLDGLINLYELDLEGDGNYEFSNTSGTFTITGGYPSNTCLHSTIKVIDDDGSQNIDIDCIPVGTGTCDCQ